MSVAYRVGIFAPSLAVGAGLGHAIAGFFPAAPAGAVVLLGMVAYFSGVVQAPLTAAVIVMEMTQNGRVTVPLMATAFLAFLVSRLVAVSRSMPPWPNRSGQRQNARPHRRCPGRGTFLDT